MRAFVEKVSTEKGIPLTQLRLSLGRDSRISGATLLQAAAAGAMEVGAQVTDFGLCTTPAMFMSTVLPGHEYDCACMLTASHLPPNRNGIKFFTQDGSANKADIKAIITGAADLIEADPLNVKWTDQGAVVSSAPATSFDFLPVYSRHLAQLIRDGCKSGDTDDSSETPLKGFKMVVDAGNGAAGFFATQVLAPLGAEVYGQFLEPDGMFPNHVPNPEDATAMKMTMQSVADKGADLGIIFDTDVDRAGFVDGGTGTAINRNELIAVLARIVLRTHPGSTVVTDSVTSNGLKRFIERLGGKHFRYRKGYKNVIDKGSELNAQGIDTLLAIETSGHGAMRENYMLDDGAYLAVKIIIELVRLRKAGDTRGVAGLLDGLDRPLQAKEFRLGFNDPSDFKAYGGQVVEAFKALPQNVEGWMLENENYEGFRVAVDEGNGKSGWLLLRQSLHDPILALNIESEVPGGMANIAKVLTEQFFPAHDNIDTTPLKKFIQEQ